MTLTWHTYPATDVPQDILYTATSTVTVSDLTGKTIAGIRVVIDSITHPYVDDLILELYTDKAPLSGIYLVVTHGGSGDNFTDTVFDPSADDSIYTASAPFTGSYIPDEASEMSALVGEVANGDYWIVVGDNYEAEDDGTLDAWSLQIATEEAGQAFWMVF